MVQPTGCLAWMSYDVENRLSVAYGFEQYAYGVDNRRVYKRNTQTNEEQLFFWSGGKVIGMYAPVLNGDNLITIRYGRNVPN